jgi:hypothetical protein
VRHADTYSYPDAYAYSNTNPNCNENSNDYTYADTNGHSYKNPYKNPNRDTNSDTNRNAIRHGHPYTNTDSDYRTLRSVVCMPRSRLPRMAHRWARWSASSL